MLSAVCGCVYRIGIRRPPVKIRCEPSDRVLLCLVPQLTQSRNVASANKSGRRSERPLVKEKRSSTIQLFDVWHGITPMEMAKVLQVERKQLAQVLNAISGKLLGDHEPIDDQLLKIIGSRFHCKFRFVADPRKTSSSSSLMGSLYSSSCEPDLRHPEPSLQDLLPRPPVVAIIGHVDHGKTTLLDHLRKSSIVQTEHGGITQHLGAFSVSLADQVKVTFLDTPGHAAFKEMRVRGARVTDIVILVVDAVEGPLEQTFESIRAAKQAHVSMIVAINKIDKPGADVERTKRALHEAGVDLEEFGGNVQCVAISALLGTNVNHLIDAILVEAEMMQLSADYKGPVQATVIESTVEPGLGKTATILVRRGVLRKNDILVADTTYVKVRMLLDTNPALDRSGCRMELKEVRPSEACKVVGWKELPQAGDEVLQAESEKMARSVTDFKRAKLLQEKQVKDGETIERNRAENRQKYHDFLQTKTHRYRDRFSNITTSGGKGDAEQQEQEAQPKMSLLLKADFDGSVKALTDCLNSYDEGRVQLDVLKVGVGSVSEADIRLAQTFNGMIYTFNVTVPDNVRQIASYLQVPIKEFKVIYSLINDLKQEINARIPHIDVENVLGQAVVLQHFLVSEHNKKVPVAGCRIIKGKLDKSKRFRLIRNRADMLYDGECASLRHFKDEVSDLGQGKECGLRLPDPTLQFNEGDEIVCYEIAKKPVLTSWDPGF